jgi:uncharacterized protein (TIGR03435 family)
MDTNKARAFWLAALFAGCSIAQTNFEVAAVKQLPTENGLPNGFTMRPRRTGGRVHWVTGAGNLIRYAYDLPVWRIAGKDVGSSFYEVDAKVDESASEEQIRSMFRSLLAERFKLVTHREQKELNGYALVVGKSGAKMRAVKPGDPAAPLPEWFAKKGEEFSKIIEGRCQVTREGRFTDAITGRRVRITALTAALEQVVRTFVKDQTGMTGDYYFSLLFARDMASNNPEEPAPDLSTALQERLGLRLEKTRAPIEMLVVDGMDRTPVGN